MPPSNTTNRIQSIPFPQWFEHIWTILNTFLICRLINFEDVQKAGRFQFQHCTDPRSSQHWSPRPWVPLKWRSSWIQPLGFISIWPATYRTYRFFGNPEYSWIRLRWGPSRIFSAISILKSSENIVPTDHLLDWHDLHSSISCWLTWFFHPASLASAPYDHLICLLNDVDCICLTFGGKKVKHTDRVQNLTVRHFATSLTYSIHFYPQMRPWRPWKTMKKALTKLRWMMSWMRAFVPDAQLVLCWNVALKKMYLEYSWMS